MHTEWGSRDCKRIGGDNVLVGGYNRVGVGTSFVACTSLSGHGEKERAEAAVT